MSTHGFERTVRQSVLDRLIEENAQLVAVDREPATSLGPIGRKAHASMGEQVLELVKRSGAPVFLLLNKVDKLHKERLLPVIERYSKLHVFQEVIPISAMKGEGLDVLLNKVVSALPPSPPYFPDDQLTDQPERFLASEIIREKVLLQTGKEVPYATAVIVERFEELPRLLRIAAAIFCERDSQKAILIGKGGSMIRVGKKLPMESRWARLAPQRLACSLRPKSALMTAPKKGNSGMRRSVVDSSTC
jgi:GTP-binding protein Era